MQGLYKRSSSSSCLQMQTELLGGSGGAETAMRDLNGSSRPRAAGVPSNKLQASQDALRAALAHRGTDTLVRLGKKFHIMDDDNSKGLSYEEVSNGSLLCPACLCRIYSVLRYDAVHNVYV